MSVWISTAILGLAWFAAVNAVASLVAWSISLFVADRVVGSARRARQLLTLRFLPIVAAAIVSVGLFVPAHFYLEPVNPDERYGFLLVMAAASAVLLGRAAWRFAAVLRASIRFGATARTYATASGSNAVIDVPGLDGIAVAGVIHPRVLIGNPARRALTRDELDVALAHERAHQVAHDNLTRVSMACVPDFFGFSAASRRIERQWEGEAECLADARAADGSPERAAHLASALIKIARLARADRQEQAIGWSTFHKPALLETRVRRLVAGQPAVPPVGGRWLGTLATLIAAAIILAWSTGLPAELHRLTEEVIESQDPSIDAVNARERENADNKNP